MSNLHVLVCLQTNVIIFSGEICTFSKEENCYMEIFNLSKFIKALKINFLQFLFIIFRFQQLLFTICTCFSFFLVLFCLTFRSHLWRKKWLLLLHCCICCLYAYTLLNCCTMDYTTYRGTNEYK